jgi:predicted ATPase
MGDPMINKIIVENFRCFKECHEIELKPLTFLVGENSTGKTSLLSAIRLATGLMQFPFGLDFNKDPFMLGAYEQIASFAGGRRGRAKYFRIGFEKHHVFKTSRVNIRIMANFVPKRGLPSIEEFIVSDRLHKIETKRTQDAEKGKMQVITTSNGIIVNQTELDAANFIWPIAVLNNFSKYLSEKIDEESDKKTSSFNLDLYYPAETTCAFAPVRTKPERTYDLKSDLPRPEGDHVPGVLRFLESQIDEKAIFRKEAEDFGSDSGLFKQIKVRSLGHGIADPFQILIKIAGTEKNLIDVGYGVSQVLPILVDTLNRKEPIFLMQQPEIHLHPRAQAALGTYFGHLVKAFNKQLIIETHSDYIIDRVCLDVRDKTTGIVPSDILILFFQRKPRQPWIRVHKITVDERGNIKGAPRSYREFFMKEQARLFDI